MRRHRWAIAVITCLTGCSSAFLSGQPDQNSPLFQVPVGSKAVLEKMVEVPAGQSEVYFQNGKTVPWYKVDIYRSYCALKVSTARQGPQMIKLDEFTIEKSYQEAFFKQVRAPAEGPVILPAVFSRMVDLDQGGNMEYQVVADVMELSSSRQPEVTTLICTDWGLPPDESHITLKKMRKTLGKFFRFEVYSPEK